MTATQADLLLSVRDLSIGVFGNGTLRTLLEGASFDVHAGETVCIVGESGSGKSISALAIMGLLPKPGLDVTGGHIDFKGRDLVRLSEEDARQLRATEISMIFQEPMTALNPLLRVGEQIEEVMLVHGKGTKSSRAPVILQALADVGLSDPREYYRRYPFELSGGQRQRVMIAMALILEPSILIADEPTTALDVTTEEKILGLLKQLQEKHGTAILFITHDFGVVREIADRIVVLERGRLVERGGRDMLSDPKGDYTRRLISSVPSIFPPQRASRMTPTLLEVSGVTLNFKRKTWIDTLLGRRPGFTGLRKIDLDVRSGEIVCVVGESGSGKSTLARCVTGLEDRWAGRIVLDGEALPESIVHRSIQQKRDIQIVFQDPYRSLNPRRRIGDSLTEGLRNLGLSRAAAESRLLDVFALIGLDEEVLSRYPHQFSGGQRQRLCLARAVVMSPRLLIADEATSALDVTVQAQVLD